MLASCGNIELKEHTVDISVNMLVSVTVIIIVAVSTAAAMF